MADTDALTAANLTAAAPKLEATGVQPIPSNPQFSITQIVPSYGTHSGRIVTVSEASVTLSRTHAGRYVRCTSSDPVAVTVPASTFQVNDRIQLEQAGEG